MASIDFCNRCGGRLEEVPKSPTETKLICTDPRCSAYREEQEKRNDTVFIGGEKDE
jgi:hypothetical protein